MTCCSAGGLTVLCKLNQCSIKFLLLLNLKSAEWNPLKTILFFASNGFWQNNVCKFFFHFFSICQNEKHFAAQRSLFFLDSCLENRRRLQISTCHKETWSGFHWLLRQKSERSRENKASVLSFLRLKLQKCHASGETTHHEVCSTRTKCHLFKFLLCSWNCKKREEFTTETKVIRPHPEIN